MSTTVSFIDLFSGCGGLSLGLMKAGWSGLLAVEKNADAFKTLSSNLVESNNQHSAGLRFEWPSWLEKQPLDIKSMVRTHSRALEKLRGTVQLVAGGPPCQGFSFAGRREQSDPRNELFKYHLKIVDLVQPSLVLLENVQGIAVPFGSNGSKSKRGRGRPRKSYATKIREQLKQHGYSVQQHVIRASDFGVPQRRPRYFTLGIRSAVLGSSPPPDLSEILSNLRKSFLREKGLLVSRPTSVAEALSDLVTKGSEIIECQDVESPSGFREIRYEKPLTSYQKLMHFGMNGTSPNSLRLVNHRSETVERFRLILRTCRKGVQLSEKDRDRLGIKKSAFVPLAPDKPSHTLTTLPDDLLHYSEPRVHTVREYARLQSFPDWFEFRGKFTTGGDRRSKECPRYTQVGNAVPPLVAEIIGVALAQILASLTSQVKNGDDGGNNVQ